MEWHFRRKDDSLDAVAQVTDEHVLVIITAVIDGERDVIGVHIGQRPEDLDAHLDALMDVAVVGNDPRPVQALNVRNPMFREAMRVRAENLPPEVGAAADPLSIDYLDDALAYVYALRQGLAPSNVIAQRRGITRRTAEGRIVRLRKMGYLSEAKGKVVGGKLTEKAVAVAEERLRRGWVRNEADPVYEVIRLAREE